MKHFSGTLFSKPNVWWFGPCSMVHYSLIPRPSHCPVFDCRMQNTESNQKLDGLGNEARYVEHMPIIIHMYIMLQFYNHVDCNEIITNSIINIIQISLYSISSLIYFLCFPTAVWGAGVERLSVRGSCSCCNSLSTSAIVSLRWLYLGQRITHVHDTTFGGLCWSTMLDLLLESFVLCMLQWLYSRWEFILTN